MVPAEQREQIAKGQSYQPSLGDVFKHFRESEMSELDRVIPDEFWADNALRELVQQHRCEFGSVDRSANIARSEQG